MRSPFVWLSFLVLCGVSSAAKADSASSALTVSVTVIGAAPEPRITEEKTFMTRDGIVTLAGTVPVTIRHIEY